MAAKRDTPKVYAPAPPMLKRFSCLDHTVLIMFGGRKVGKRIATQEERRRHAEGGHALIRGNDHQQRVGSASVSSPVCTEALGSTEPRC